MFHLTPEATGLLLLIEMERGQMKLYGYESKKGESFDPKIPRNAKKMSPEYAYSIVALRSSALL